MASWGDLVGGVLGEQEAGQHDDIVKSNRARVRCRCLRRPLHGGGGADVGVALVAGEGCECLQIAAGVVELVAEGSPQCEIAVYVVTQHVVVWGHGWTISPSRSKSILA